MNGILKGTLNIFTITNTLAGYYSESAKMFVSCDTKYYDEIITKQCPQAREPYKSTMQYPENQKIHNEQVLHSEEKRKRILLVDDEPDICMVYQIVLEDAGFQCISYTDSVKALKEFKPYYYDLILLDIKMPVLNGFELCKKIREIDKIVHIVFITASEAYYEKFREEHFPELGKINYIQKPIGNEELVQIVNMIVSNSITID
jgi:CheY-like chemotaxis protein